MSAAIEFLTGNGYPCNEAAGSGVGFYGAGFGASIPVGSYQDRTYVTSGAGTTQGVEAPNVKYINSGSGVLGQAGSGIGLRNVPNQQATLNIRFTNDTAVQVQSATFRAYDRASIDNSPSGVVVKAFSCIHPNISQSTTGSGDSTWTTLGGSGSVLSLPPSPGPSGLYAGNGSNSTFAATQHDFYVGLSASPSSISSKLFAAYCALEYL